MARLIQFTDQSLQNDKSKITFSPDQRIVGISLKNQGTTGIGMSMNNNSLAKRLEAGEETSYGGLSIGNDPTYLNGFLAFQFDSLTGRNLVYTVAVDLGPQVESKC